MSGWPVGVAAALAVALLAPPRDRLRLSGFRLTRPTVVSAARRRAAELDWVEALAAELRSGRDPHAALLAADRATVTVVSAAASAAARTGSGVADALRRDAHASALLRGVAACWDVSAGSGAGLAAALVTLADSAREEQRIRDELRAGLAEPRATALVLACLPVLGLGLGVVLGADPVAWLIGSPVGAAVLAAGLLLESVGAVWAWRIASSMEALL